MDQFILYIFIILMYEVTCEPIGKFRKHNYLVQADEENFLDFEYDVNPSDNTKDDFEDASQLTDRTTNLHLETNEIDADLAQDKKKTSSRLAAGIDKTATVFAGPLFQRGTLSYKAFRDLENVVQKMPIIGSILRVFTSALGMGRTLTVPGVNLAVNTLEKSCAPLKAMVRNFVRYENSNMESLKIALVTELKCFSFPIALAHRAIPRSKHFNKKYKTVIYLHGYTNDPLSWSSSEIASAFLDLAGYNIMVLDSSSILRYDYLKASSCVKYIGQRLAKLLIRLFEGGSVRKDVLLIGHSLGAHIAAHAGRAYRALTGSQLPRISALDPAGPCFESSLDPTLKLTKEDAEFVDVIHTNAGVAGLVEPYGHVDFYVNGGSVQAGCLEILCDHDRAFEYYAESVLNPDAFLAIECEDWHTFLRGGCEDRQITRMGYGASSKEGKIFYLRTSPRKPYGISYQGIV